MKTKAFLLSSILLIGFSLHSCKKEVIDISGTTWRVICPSPIDTFNITFYNDHTIDNSAGGNWSQSNSTVEFDIPSIIFTDTIIFYFIGSIDDETMSGTFTSSTGGSNTSAWTATME